LKWCMKTQCHPTTFLSRSGELVKHLQT
jgi:hypothetical protein